MYCLKNYSSEVRNSIEDGAAILVNNDTYNFVMSIGKNRVVLTERINVASLLEVRSMIQSVILVVLNVRIYSNHTL
jgi:hypothetical protein